MNRAELKPAAIAFAIWLALAHSAHAGTTSPRNTETSYLKKWALSRCLGKVYTDDTAKNDANATAGAYLELSRAPVDAYEALDQLAARYASRDYRASDGSSLGTMKCIDLFDSNALNQLATTLAQRRANERRPSLKNSPSP